MKPYIIAAAVAIVCLLSLSVGMWWLKSSNNGEEDVMMVDPNPLPPPEDITNTTTIPPSNPKEPSMDLEEEDTKIQNTFVIYDALGRPYYPTRYERFRRRYHNHHFDYPSPLEPGGGFPDLINMKKDKAVEYVLQTYPNLSVSTIRYGDALPKDVRFDRMIIIYEAFSQRVVAAHIG